jgi:hypothetical protein
MKLHVCWVNLLKNQIIQNFEGKDYKTRLIFYHLAKIECSMSSIFLALGVGYMCKKESCEKTCLVVH